VIVVRPVEPGGDIVSRAGDHLRQPLLPGGGGGVAVKQAFLADQGKEQQRVEAVALRLRDHQVAIVNGIAHPGQVRRRGQRGDVRLLQDVGHAGDRVRIGADPAQPDRQLVARQRIVLILVKQPVEFLAGLRDGQHRPQLPSGNQTRVGGKRLRQRP